MDHQGFRRSAGGEAAQQSTEEANEVTENGETAQRPQSFGEITSFRKGIFQIWGYIAHIFFVVCEKSE